MGVGRWGVGRDEPGTLDYSGEKPFKLRNKGDPKNPPAVQKTLV